MKPVFRKTNISRILTSLVLMGLGILFAEFYPEVVIWNGITVVGMLITAGASIFSYTALDEIARLIIDLKREWDRKE